MALELTPFDPAEYLDDAETMAAYLEDALEDEDPSEFFAALNVIVRAKSMTASAPDDGVARQTPSSSAATSDLDFATVLAMMKSLGLGLRIVPNAFVADRKPAATAG